MPHYKDGTKAEVFDEVMFARYDGVLSTGVVLAIHEGAESCNLTVATLATRLFQKHDPATDKFVVTHKSLGFSDQSVTAKDAERADLFSKRVPALQV